jgi:enamine deaminase RidA (YjgF/YER057c/UK114 family)
MSRPISAVRLIRSAALTDTAPYAYAATTGAAATHVFAAGACPLDESGATVAPGDLVAQARQCVANLVTALEAAGATLEDVAYTRVLVATTAREDLVTAWTVVHDAFGEHEVPSKLHGVTVLGYPDQLVEIEAVAALSRPAPSRGS